MLSNLYNLYPGDNTEGHGNLLITILNTVIPAGGREADNNPIDNVLELYADTSIRAR